MNGGSGAAHSLATASAVHCMRSNPIRRSTYRKTYSLKLPTGCRFASVRKRLPTNSSLVQVSPTEKSLCLIVTHRKLFLLKVYPQKNWKVTELPTQKYVCVLLLPTQKRFASMFFTQNRNFLSLPTKVGFFEKVPTEEQKRLGDTHLWN